MSFRFARVVDGFDSAGRPVLWGTVDDPAERSRLLGYLRGSAVAFTSATYGTDVFTGERMVVRAEYRTDGQWILPEAVAYYLERHGTAPEPDLRVAIAARGYVAPPVDPATVAAAREAVVEFE